MYLTGPNYTDQRRRYHRSQPVSIPRRYFETPSCEQARELWTGQEGDLKPILSQNIA